MSQREVSFSYEAIAVEGVLDLFDQFGVILLSRKNHGREPVDEAFPIVSITVSYRTG